MAAGLLDTQAFNPMPALRAFGLQNAVDLSVPAFDAALRAMQGEAVTRIAAE